jgi:hypothetical protein
MRRFENVKEGDAVYSRMHGWGVVTCLRGNKDYPMLCSFEKQYTNTFNLDGKSDANNVEPTLFYVDGDNNYATERPEPKVDWSKVPVDTKVYCCNSKENYKISKGNPRHFSRVDENGILFSWTEGCTSFTAGKYGDMCWNYMWLAE